MQEDQLYDYIKCPAMYDMKHIKKIPLNRVNTFKDCIKYVANYYYTNLLNNKVLSTNDIKKKWDNVCEKNTNIINDKLNIEGLSLLINFVRWNENNKTVLADFNSSYEMEINGVTINGIFNAIAVLPGRKCEIIINDFGRIMPDQYSLDKNLKITLDCMAFKKIYGIDISGIKIIYHKNNTEFYTTRNNNDNQRLISSIKSIDIAIKNNCFYPRENVFCKKCFYKEYCKYWFV